MKTKEISKDKLENWWEKQFQMPLPEEGLLTETDNFYILRNTIFAGSAENDWLKIIKQILFFLPGAFLLFMTSTFLFEAFFSMNWSFFQVLVGVPWLFLYGFMVIFGLGDLKNPKHLILPFSIVGISFVVYLSSLLFGDSARLSFLSYYSMYLFPLVLTIPVLLKNLTDEKPEQS